MHNITLFILITTVFHVHDKTLSFSVFSHTRSEIMQTKKQKYQILTMQWLVQLIGKNMGKKMICIDTTAYHYRYL